MTSHRAPLVGNRHPIPPGPSYPGYVALAATGELGRRAAKALHALESCRQCPRACRTNRLAPDRMGICRGRRFARVASFGPHLGEEDCLRGWRGSGTIFFAGCNLGCVFCQNWEISHDAIGREVSPERLAAMMLELQDCGCHNINWVTPSHYVAQALEALNLAAEGGLILPIVYNTSAYDSVDTLRLLHGVVDIYMPDFKFWDPAAAERLTGRRDYPEVARRALLEMHRQVGDLVVDEMGLARRGVLVRHLVMPGGIAGTPDIARWLGQRLSVATYINVMAQYRPAGEVAAQPDLEHYADIARPVTEEEVEAALAAARAAGLHRFADPG